MTWSRTCTPSMSSEPTTPLSSPRAPRARCTSTGRDGDPARGLGRRRRRCGGRLALRAGAHRQRTRGRGHRGGRRSPVWRGLSRSDVKEPRRPHRRGRGRAPGRGSEQPRGGRARARGIRRQAGRREYGRRRRGGEVSNERGQLVGDRHVSRTPEPVPFTPVRGEVPAGLGGDTGAADICVPETTGGLGCQGTLPIRLMRIDEHGE